MSDVYAYFAPEEWRQWQPLCGEQSINRSCRCGSFMWNRGWGDLWYCRCCGAQARASRPTTRAGSK